ncbi:MAG TPA: hypothetical protein HA286_04090 [Candidatus Poseidoniaceae archaeon]|nr:MAG TPA: hypothetical protein D7H96_04035 [Candidatus Poseidoniales archaeon]HIH53439.1 hypothetical protein [Candidatus Poseidoniaceae archaeon]
MNATRWAFAALVPLLLVAVSWSVFSSDETPVQAETSEGECNGMDILCDRPYDEVTFPETHNAFATHADGIFYPASNHRSGLDAQWDAGMRAFMLDTHYLDRDDPLVDEVRLCHGSHDGAISPCSYGRVDPSEWLGELEGLMAEAPRDVVTLLIENYVEPDHLWAQFSGANLTERVYVHELNTPWPTLGELVDDGTTLVLFWEQANDEAHPQFHGFTTYGWTTNYAESNPEDMNCDVHRGDGDQPVYHMNNWLGGPAGLSDPLRAEEVNDVDFIVERATECWVQHGKRPTFVAVDWWEDGDVVEAVRQINLLDAPEGA